MDSPNTLLTKFHQIYQSINKTIKQTFGLQTPRRLPTPAKVKHRVGKKLFRPRESTLKLPKTPALVVQTEDQKIKELERKLDWLIKEKLVEVDGSHQKSPFSLNPGFDLGLSPTPVSITRIEMNSIETETTKASSIANNISKATPIPEPLRLINLDPKMLLAGKNALVEPTHSPLSSPKIPLNLFQEMKTVKLKPTPLQERPLKADSVDNRLLLDLQSKFKNAGENEENLLEWSDAESLKGVFE